MYVLIEEFFGWAKPFVSCLPAENCIISVPSDMFARNKRILILI